MASITDLLKANPISLKGGVSGFVKRKYHAWGAKKFEAGGWQKYSTRGRLTTREALRTLNTAAGREVVDLDAEESAISDTSVAGTGSTRAPSTSTRPWRCTGVISMGIEVLARNAASSRPEPMTTRSPVRMSAATTWHGSTSCSKLWTSPSRGPKISMILLPARNPGFVMLKSSAESVVRTFPMRRAISIICGARIPAA